MGCHTWGYKKLSACSKQEQDNFIEQLNNEVENDVFNCSFEEYFKETKQLAEFYIEQTKKYGNKKDVDEWRKYALKAKAKERWKRQNQRLEPFKNGVTLHNVKEYCKEFKNSTKYKVVNDILYIEKWFDSPFRVYGYPEDTFSEAQSLMNWLKQQKDENNVVYYLNDKSIKVTESNWHIFKAHIDGFFMEEGIDNCYFEFG